MKVEKLQIEIEASLMSAAEALLQQLLREDTEIDGGHIHDLMRACAANLAQGLAPRVLTEEQLDATLSSPWCDCKLCMELLETNGVL